MDLSKIRHCLALSEPLMHIRLYLFSDNLQVNVCMNYDWTVRVAEKKSFFTNGKAKKGGGVKAKPSREKNLV